MPSPGSQALLRLPQLPLNANGKVDKSRLPEPLTAAAALETAEVGTVGTDLGDEATNMEQQMASKSHETWMNEIKIYGK